MSEQLLSQHDNSASPDDFDAWIAYSKASDSEREEADRKYLNKVKKEKREEDKETEARMEAGEIGTRSSRRKRSNTNVVVETGVDILTEGGSLTVDDATSKEEQAAFVAGGRK